MKVHVIGFEVSLVALTIYFSSKSKRRSCGLRRCLYSRKLAKLKPSLCVYGLWTLPQLACYTGPWIWRSAPKEQPTWSPLTTSKIYWGPIKARIPTGLDINKWLIACCCTSHPNCSIYTKTTRWAPLPLSREGSLSCYACSDTGPRFLRSQPKDSLVRGNADLY